MARKVIASSEQDEQEEEPSARRIARQMRDRHSHSKGPKVIDASTLLSTGSTLLNLALSDTPTGGFALGKMVNLIGDSSSGKTFFALSCFAEAARDKRFDKYEFIYDDVEAANEFDMDYLFGRRCSSRIRPPSEKDDQECSDTIQDFQDNIMAAIKRGKPFIYILDSFDALSSEEEESRSEENAKLRAANKDVKSTYGMEKAKIAGMILRQIIRALDKTESILIIISQTRDNIDPMSFQKKTRSGGRALKFYATHEIWMAIGKTHKKKERAIGVDTEIKVTKNKLTGKKRDVTTSIFYDYGIDDIGACIDFLLEEGVWTKNKLTIDAEDLGLSGTREKLIGLIEDGKRSKELRELTGNSWKKIENSLRLGRKPKYDDDDDDDNEEDED